MSLILEAKGLTVSLGNRWVVDGVDMTVSAGELVGLIGPNGAGKTSLLRALLRFLPLTTGTLTLMGEDVSSLPAHRLAGRIAYLPQSPTVHWPLSVEALVALGRGARPIFARQSEVDREAIERAMRLADIAGLRDRPATELSGGERARVLLARALAADAPLLLADEPVAALDPAHQLSVMNVLKEVATGGKAVVVVMHDLSLAARYCDRLIVLDGGRKVAEGTPADVLTDTLLAKVYGVRVSRGEAGAVTPVSLSR
ncbi:ABC transporter ATP-binding protein [Pseudokordiimonas caeni]|uniref:ABC transporter ATP-binding protein n=1 Tax=Pseudokordiimonas caeni TaxID=2997908 RepID=UPI0028113C0E|nr:ABC transporter ATP-binding protein [Pseudokordiimonas caeni]